MVSDEQYALLFLAYLVVPLVLLLVAWIVGLLVRKVLKKGQGEAGAEET